MRIDTRILLIVAVATLRAAAGPASVAAQDAVPCDAVELVSGNQRYNRLVCSGIDMLDQGRFGEAVRYLEDASNVMIFEFPNFMILPRLALAYWRLGDKSKATEYLNQSHLSLSVLIGIYQCEERNDGVRIVDAYGGEVKEPGIIAVLRRMCGAAYEYVYEQISFEIYLDNARLIQHHLEIARVIQGN